jgi:RimJ/RimL family protein N-acetyltransferase
MTPAPWEVPPTGAAAGIAGRIAAALPELRTARLRLRAPRLGDFDAYAAILCSGRAVHVGGPATREEAWLDFAQMAAGWLLRGYGVWTVERLEDGALLGFLPLNHEFGDPEPELGFLFLAEAEGRGYAREAAEAARAHAFGTLGWTGVVSYVGAGNGRSIRLAERLGARLDAAPQGVDPDILVYRHTAEPRP